MGYFKYTRNKHGKLGLLKKMPCFKCGTVIELGAVFYSKATKRRVAKNSIKHLCEFCYEKQYITA